MKNRKQSKVKSIRRMSRNVLGTPPPTATIQPAKKERLLKLDQDELKEYLTERHLNRYIYD